MSSETVTIYYWRPKYGGCREHAYRMTCQAGSTLDEIAEAVAEDFHVNHDGWEAKWPIEFAIVVVDVIHTVCVDREAVPSFYVVPT